METVGRYQLIKKLATGGMAEVFLASAEGPGGFSKQLVVKRILPHFADNPQFVQMFLSEAKLAAQLNHPNIVQVFDFGKAGRDYFLAMEFVDGMNLRSLNRMHRIRQGPMPMALCARMISQACEGLAYAHSFRDPKTNRPVNLVHRDISPDNLIISKHGSVKVLDFGIAKAETQVHKTSTGMLKGKMAYMPPEQLQREPLDQRVDVYALGVVLFELLAGSLPFDATSEVSIIQAVMKPDPMPPLGQVVSGVPPQLEQVVARALAKARDTRYPDCKAFQQDLEAFIQSTGEQCLPSDLAALVDVAEAAYNEETRRSLVPVLATPEGDGSGEPFSGHDSTYVAPGNQGHITGVSNTQLKPVGDGSEAQAATPKSGGSSKAVMGAAAGLVLGAAALSAYVVFSNNPTEVKNPIVVPPPPEPGAATARDASTAAPTASADSGAAVAGVEADAGSEVAQARPESDAGSGSTVGTEHRPTRDAGTKSHKERTNPPPTKGKGEVEVRIRPYAVLWIDGEKVGETPFEEPLQLSTGKHRFRMVNEKFNLDVTVDFTVKAGKSVFKYNLME